MFEIDHDYHIHTSLSSCSNDPAQTAETLLKYAESNGYSEICATDHFWDENVLGASEWYRPQNYKHISSLLPLPQSDAVSFYFGCETELDKNMTLGLSDKMIDKFDFIIIPTTHLHMTGFTVERDKTSVEDRAKIYADRLDKLLDKDLPFHKIGIAHLTTLLISYNRAVKFDEHLRILDKVSDRDFKDIFTKLAKRGAGVELNFTPSRYTEEQMPRALRPYIIAKEAGCKFYLGSDAHHPDALDKAPDRFEKMIALLKLEEKDRYRFN